MSMDPATPVTLDPERSGLGGSVPIIHSAGGMQAKVLAEAGLS
jgi:hypothetical protein